VTNRFDGGAAPKPLPLAAAVARGERLRASLGALRLARFARALGNPYLTQSLNGASLRQTKLPSKNFNKKLE